MIYGARISLFTGVVSVIIGANLGGIVGALAGGIGGRVDTVLMRIVDVLLAIPGILLAIGIVAWLGPGPAPDHVRGRGRRMRRSSPGSCAAACSALREVDYVIGRALARRVERAAAAAPHAAQRADAR